MTLDPVLLLATQRQQSLQAEAAQRALVRVATCCRPSTWRRAWQSLQERPRRRAVCCA